ncbi:MAG: hypothetical protein H6685_11005 [Deltaproteobacteria bacterium]|nr:hypothetical protein [Deltaproteobacteria bacterium]
MKKLWIRLCVVVILWTLAAPAAHADPEPPDPSSASLDATTVLDHILGVGWTGDVTDEEVRLLALSPKDLAVRWVRQGKVDDWAFVRLAGIQSPPDRRVATIAAALRRCPAELWPPRITELIRVRSGDEVHPPYLHLVRLFEGRPGDEAAEAMAFAALASSFGRPLPQDPDIYAVAFDDLYRRGAPGMAEGFGRLFATGAYELAADLIALRKIDVSRMDGLAFPDGAAPTSRIAERVNAYAAEAVRKGLADASLDDIHEWMFANRYEEFAGVFADFLERQYLRAVYDSADPAESPALLTLWQRIDTSSTQILDGVIRAAQAQKRQGVAQKAWTRKKFRATRDDATFTLPPEGAKRYDFRDDPAWTGVEMNIVDREGQWTRPHSPAWIAVWALLLAAVAVSSYAVRRKKYKLLAMLGLPLVLIAVAVHFALDDESAKPRARAAKSPAAVRTVAAIGSQSMWLSRTDPRFGRLLFMEGTPDRRAVELSVDKEPGERRIVGLGASPLMGSPYRREDAFFFKIAKEVDDADPAHFYVPVDYALGGGSLFEGLLLADDIFVVQPDAAVIYHAVAPLYTLQRMLREGELLGRKIDVAADPRAKKRIRDIMFRLQEFSDRLSETPGKRRMTRAEADVMRQIEVDLLEVSADALFRRFQRSNVPMLVVLTASPPPNPRHSEINQAIQRVALKYNATVVDGQAIIDRAVADGARYEDLFRDDTHLRREGHAAMARALGPAMVELLTKKGLLPPAKSD